MRRSKKALASVMALSMLLSTACSSADPKESQADSNGVGTTAEDQANDPTGSATDPGNDPVQSKDGKYTYRYSLTDFPTNWNPHTYQTATDAEILDYAQDGFFTFDYNETKDGYRIVPAMATKEPEDITSLYVGKYGVEEGDTAKVWKLTLRDDLKWQDGTAIHAADFVTSAKLLLNPVANNYRADSLYSGNLQIYNAKNYLYQGKHAYANTMIAADLSGYAAVEDLIKNADGVYTIDGTADLRINLYDGAMWSSNGLADYYAAYGASMATKGDVDLYETVLAANADDDGNVAVTEEVAEALMHITALLHGYDDVEGYAEDAGDYAYQEWEEFCYVGYDYPTVTMDEVGVFATGENELVLVLEKPLKGFYFLYSLTGTWLVNEPLYTKNEKVENGVYTNTYGTSADTFMSYGPYKLTAFQADKEYTLERNDNYYGITDDTYQTTAIVVSCVKEASAKLELFLQGQLDSYGLTVDDMEKYSTSDYCYYTTGDSTFFIALNPDKTALEKAQEALGDNYNKTILTVEEFRQALSFGIDRAAFALATAPTNDAAFGMFSSLIISDPENGTAYRTTEEAKWVLAEFWGMKNDIGPGKMYETVDDAVDSITGYNLAMAKQYFDKAYDKAIAEGLMDENDVVQIMIGLPNSTSKFYSKGNEFIVNCYTEAVKGTKLEGKLTFAVDDTLGNGFADALRSNKVDLLFGVGWTGSALDPYGLMEAYTSSDYQYDPSWNTTTAMIDIELNGKVYTASAWDWTRAISGEEITIKDADGNASTFSAGSTEDDKAKERFQILVALEGAVLRTYDLIPLIDDASASLKGQKYEYYTEDYIYGVGRGGVKYMTYNYNDEEWEAYVSSQGGKLSYE